MRHRLRPAVAAHVGPAQQRLDPQLRVAERLASPSLLGGLFGPIRVSAKRRPLTNDRGQVPVRRADLEQRGGRGGPAGAPEDEQEKRAASRQRQRANALWPVGERLVRSPTRYLSTIGR